MCSAQPGRLAINKKLKEIEPYLQQKRGIPFKNTNEFD